MYIVYYADFSGVDNTKSFEYEADAVIYAKKLWDHGDGGYEIVSVHYVEDGDPEKIDDSNLIKIFPIGR